MAEGLTFNLINDGTEYEVGQSGKSHTNLLIPETYNGLPVTRICNEAFYSYKNLVSVTIPDSVTKMGYRSLWNCVNLRTIILPSSITFIGYGTFSSCPIIEAIYYGGTSSKFNSIAIEVDNDDLLKSTIYYYSETKPSSSGNYWHYEEDGVTPEVW